MTLKQAIRILTKRADWLTLRISEAKAKGVPFSFDASERDAINRVIAAASRTEGFHDPDRVHTEDK